MSASQLPQAAQSGSSVWQAWTPTLTNITLGNGSVSARYSQDGKTVRWHFKFRMGSTSAMDTSPKFTLPVVAHADYMQNFVMGQATLLDWSTGSAEGRIVMDDPATGRCFVYSRGTYDTGITATAPFTWVTDDGILAYGMYEAA